MTFGAFSKDMAYKPMSEINTTPMVDVMLVLLIIFMVTVPLLTHDVPVNLPKTGSGMAEEKSGNVALSVNAAGQVFWDDVFVPEGRLAEKFQVAAQATPQPEIRLRADRDARYGVIAGIITAAQEAGLQRLGFITQPERQ